MLRRADLRERAIRLRSQGLGAQSIADIIDVPRSTVRYWTDARFRQAAKRCSHAAKRRRVGSCVKCGSQTHYDGKGDVSKTCTTCANNRPKGTR
jgi:NADH pyrophosphatase NudC (nudix superfamily)